MCIRDRVGGGIAQESGTIAFFEDTDTFFSIVMEPDTDFSNVPFNIILEDTRQHQFDADGTSKIYSLGTEINADTDELIVYINGVKVLPQIYKTSRSSLYTNWSASGSNLSLIHIYEPTRLLSISYAVFCL